jgi:hypothetical protein
MLLALEILQHRSGWGRDMTCSGDGGDAFH